MTDILTRRHRKKWRRRYVEKDGRVYDETISYISRNTSCHKVVNIETHTRTENENESCRKGEEKMKGKSSGGEEKNGKFERLSYLGKQDTNKKLWQGWKAAESTCEKTLRINFVILSTPKSVPCSFFLFLSFCFSSALSRRRKIGAL